MRTPGVVLSTSTDGEVGVLHGTLAFFRAIVRVGLEVPLLGLAVAVLTFVAPAEASPSVAVADLRNLTGDPELDALGAGAADLLLGRLQRSGAVTVVERDALNAVVSELSLGTSGWTDPNTVAETGRLIGARYLITGSLVSAGLPHLAVSIRVIDSESAEVVLTREVAGLVEGGDDFLALMDDVTAQTLEALDLEVDTSYSSQDADREREREALDRWGVRFAGAALNHPDALYRDRSHDQEVGPYEGYWKVYSNEGKEVAMPHFSRTVGDNAGAMAYVDGYVASKKKRRRRSLQGVGLMVASAAAVTATGVVRQEPVGPGVGLLATTGICTGVGFLVGAPIGHVVRMEQMSYPSAFYEPQEADQWIDRYNASLR